MANELTTQQTGELLQTINRQDLGELLQPLIREIHLFDTYVAGTTHLKDPTVLTQIKENDRLTLQREENKFDSKAILVLTQDGRKLGYIPEKDNQIFARLMDAGKLLTAKIKNIQKKRSFTQIAIGIYLTDF